MINVPKFKSLRDHQYRNQFYSNQKGQIFAKPAVKKEGKNLKVLRFPTITRKNGAIIESPLAGPQKGLKMRSVLSPYPMIKRNFFIKELGKYTHRAFLDGNPKNETVKNIVYVSDETHSNIVSGMLRNLPKIKTNVYGYPHDWDDLNEEEFKFFKDVQNWNILRTQWIDKSREEATRNMNVIRQMQERPADVETNVDDEIMSLSQAEIAFIKDAFYDDEASLDEIATGFKLSRSTVRDIIMEDEEKATREFQRRSRAGFYYKKKNRGRNAT